MGPHSPGKRTITDVVDGSPSGAVEPFWHVYVRHHEDGLTYAHVFHHSIFAALAGEYGFDPYDFDTLIDVVLHQPFSDLQENNPTHPYNTDEVTARRAHLQRVADVKKTHTFEDPEGMLNRIKAKHSPDLSQISVIKEKVHSLRAASLRGR